MPDDLTRWRKIADFDCRGEEPARKALSEAADEVERLRKELAEWRDLAERAGEARAEEAVRSDDAEAERDAARADHKGMVRRLRVAQQTIAIKDQAITRHLAAIDRARTLCEKAKQDAARYREETGGYAADLIDPDDVLAVLDTLTEEAATDTTGEDRG